MRGATGRDVLEAVRHSSSPGRPPIVPRPAPETPPEARDAAAHARASAHARTPGSAVAAAPCGSMPARRGLRRRARCRDRASNTRHGRGALRVPGHPDGVATRRRGLRPVDSRGVARVEAVSENRQHRHSARPSWRCRACCRTPSRGRTARPTTASSRTGAAARTSRPPPTRCWTEGAATRRRRAMTCS